MNRAFEDLEHAGFDLSLSRLQMFKDFKKKSSFITVHLNDFGSHKPKKNMECLHHASVHWRSILKAC